MITIKGKQVTAQSPEGASASMPLDRFLDKIGVTSGSLNTGEDMLPDGVKAIRSRDGVTIVVHEASPQIYNLKWIAADSPTQYGKGTKYRNVSVAVPYLLMLAAFQRVPDGRRCLTSASECFFRTEPLTSWKDELSFPGLLNVSKWPKEAGHPLAWICVQHLNFGELADSKQPMRDGLAALLQCLIGTGFNRSSEAHEGSSWFEESRKVDKRIATVEQWEQSTKEDPLFALEVPWISTGRTLDQVVERIFDRCGGKKPQIDSDWLAKHIFNTV